MRAVRLLFGQELPGKLFTGVAWRACQFWIALICVFLGAGGCSSNRHSIHDARLAFAQGDAKVAADAFAELEGRDSVTAELDLAIVELAQGRRRSAESRLRKWRDHFDQMPEIAPVREGVSLLTDDRARPYRPAGYEEIMIRALLAVCSITGDDPDAESYSLQAELKQRELAQLANERGLLAQGLDGGDPSFQPIAVAPYIRGMIRESTHRDYGEAARAYQLVQQVQPGFQPAHEDIARASGGVHSSPGHGVLYVIGLVGRGPIMHEVEAESTTLALSIASAVLNEQTNEDDEEESDEADAISMLPNIASVKVPRVHVPSSEVSSLLTVIDGVPWGATQTLTSVAELAVRQNELEMPWTIARAVVRRSLKESLVAATRKQVGISGDAGKLFHFAAASVWSATEKADTRCWGLLPREIQVLRAEVPAGEHVIELSPLNLAGDPVAVPTQRRVNIVDGRNAYLLAVAPDRWVYVTQGEQ